MRREDLAEVFAIESAAYEFPWTQGNFRDSLGSGYQCWVCREGGNGTGRMVGYFVLMVAAGQAHLLNLCVAIGRQRRGYGWRILEQALGVAREQCAASFFLEVRPTNIPARQLYSRAGFAEVGVRRDYYPASGRREDALVMEKGLT